MNNQDRNTLVKFASLLPKGSPERRAILAAYSTFSPSLWKGHGFRDEARRFSFSFRKQALADLWTKEILGQMSDGMWENSNRDDWNFWHYMPITVGGSTKLNGGQLPYGVRGYRLDHPELLEAVGDRMLEYVQETEPNATMVDVKKYLREIMLAMRGRETLTKDDVPGVPAPTSMDESSQIVVSNTDHARMIRTVCVENGIEPNPWKILGEALLYAPSGSRAGQYHYFAILPMNKMDGAHLMVACSAYGKIGSTPKGVPIGSGNLVDCIKAIRAKARSKIASGYFPNPIRGAINSLDIVSGRITKGRVD